jgi:DNA-binding NarL/FixJ family response regulator
MDSEKIRVLIADDHPLYRDGMHGLLDSVPETEVVGEAASGEEAISLAESLQPDVILMDIKMPGINGLQAMREILHTSPHIRILIVSMLEDDDSVFAAMRAGACGYVPKGCQSGRDVARHPGCGKRRSHLWTGHCPALDRFLFSLAAHL